MAFATPTWQTATTYIRDFTSHDVSDYDTAIPDIEDLDSLMASINSQMAEKAASYTRGYTRVCTSGYISS